LDGVLKDIDHLKNRPLDWDDETDFKVALPEWREQAKAIVRSHAAFGLPFVSTDGFGSISLQYEDFRYSEIRCSSKGRWMYYDADSARSLGEQPEETALAVFDELYLRATP
jgi:hypothetical protein